MTILAVGGACAGQSRAVSLNEAVAVYREALDQGIGTIDAARGYGKAEQALGRVLEGRRDEVFVTTKVRADDRATAQQSFERSLRTLRTDHVDLLYLHDVGTCDVGRTLGPGGALEYILEQKEAGRTRLVSATTHCRPPWMLKFVETGLLDVIMVTMNFVDRHQYGFEDRVLPVARERGVGVMAMKVLGGERGSDWRRYNGPNPGPQIDRDKVALAIRYALGLDGVAAAVVGMHTVEQVRANARLARRFEALSPDERAELERLGRQLVATWGPRYGPTA